MNLGIFGGTFNPIHNGHITASLKFYDEAKLDMLLIIPDRIPPHKEGKIASAEHRLNMLHLVYDDEQITGDRNIVISRTELTREGKSYTIVTLRELKETYPDAKLFLYTGSDMFYTLENWCEGAGILSMCTIYTAAREENEQEKLCQYAEKYKSEYGTECIIGNFAPIVSSSTKVRECFEHQNDKKHCNFTNNLLTESVNRYIMENVLYTGNGNSDTAQLILKVKNDLPLSVGEKRLGHILAVAETAGFLADFFARLRADICRDKVILAALLHDVTKYMDQEKLCEKYGIALTEDDKNAMQTVHSITGAYYSKDVYGIDDCIFNAIKHHTTGNEEMSLTEKIIFVSDYCEETRVHEQCRIMRQKLMRIVELVKDLPYSERLCKAVRYLDLITAEILGKTVFYLKQKSAAVHSKTLSTLESLISKYKNDSEFINLCEEYL